MPARDTFSTTARLGLLAALSLGLSFVAGPAWAGGTGRAATEPPAVATGVERSAVVGVPGLTPDQRLSIARKDAGVATTLGRTTRGARAVPSEGEDPVELPSHRSVKAIRQKAQVRTYWCGPATLETLVQASGVDLSQKTAAKRLRTTRNGTNWYSGGGTYPMEKALERYSDGFDYAPANLPYTPTAVDVQTFRERLMTDVAVHRQGIAGNAVEVRNGPHLNGHPNRTIYHWVAVRGYDDGGETTRYADPVAGSSISWGGPVERYNEISTDKIVTIFGARGYIW